MKRDGVLLLAAMVLMAAEPAAAQMSAGAPLATAWQKGESSKLRLIAGDTTGSVWTAVLQVSLDAGWKTYWRNPGDSGVPPRFDFAGSDNVERAQVRFPSPHRFSDTYGDSIGYKDSVAFPIEVAPADDGRPVRLSVKFDYAVCEKICVPASASLSIRLAPGRPDLAGEVAAAFKTVPVRDDGDRLRARSGEGDSLILLFDAPQGARDVDLFAEPPEGWYLSLPRPVGRDEGGRYRFTLSLAGRKEGAFVAGERFTLTGVSDKGAFERTLTLD
ncbi:MAG: protein-disulfide reductase DsbD domain-containing protein [Flavobacteriaceae bacterium]